MQLWGKPSPATLAIVKTSSFSTPQTAGHWGESCAQPGHRPGFLPNFLADNGAEVVIAGGMGGGAVDIFEERGVKVILGVQGDAQEAVEAYLRGELVSSGSVCHEHEHADECGEHK